MHFDFSRVWPLVTFVPWSALKGPASGAARSCRAEASPRSADAVAPLDAPLRPGERAAWWVRALAAIPLPVLYGVAGVLASVADCLVTRRREVRSALAQAFPDLSAEELRSVRRRHSLRRAQVLAETVKAVSFTAEEIRSHVRIVNLEKVQAVLARRQSVLLITARQCNWEWMLLALSLDLGYPLDAACEPQAIDWAEREMTKLRSRFGTRTVAARDLLADVLRRDGVLRAVVMPADQEPHTAERTHWTRFLNRDAAFNMDAEEIARITRFPAFFIAMRRLGRGYYELEFLPLPHARQSQPRGPLTEQCARLIERQIHAAPEDWLGFHERWQLPDSSTRMAQT